jgi:DNA-binding NarL/FixJ family response regulator
MGAQEGWFLVVDDDDNIARMISRALERHRPTRSAGTCARALSVLDEQLAGLVVDMGLPDGDGLTVLEVALVQRPSLPALVLTGSDDPRYTHEAFRLGASYLRKPGELSEIHEFARRAVADARGDEERTRAAIDVWVKRYRLTPREAEIIGAAMDGTDHARLAALAGVTVGTIKNQVHRLLCKVGTASLQELVRQILRTAPG